MHTAADVSADFCLASRQSADTASSAATSIVTRAIQLHYASSNAAVLSFWVAFASEAPSDGDDGDECGVFWWFVELGRYNYLPKY